MNKQHIVAATLGALMSMPMMAQAQTNSMAVTGGAMNTAPAGNGMPSASDIKFVVAAAQGGMTEVDTSKLALKTTKNADIKKFAQQMVNDHSKANDQLKKTAKKVNVTVPKNLDAEHQAELDQLKKASGADFDQKYIAVQDKEHNDAVTAFQTEADHGDNQSLKMFAANTLPTLQGHMNEVKALEQKMPPAATSGAMMNKTP